MKAFGLTLIAIAIALQAVPANAAEMGRTSFDLKGNSEGGVNFFTEGTATTHNPTLEVPASGAITINFTVVGDTPHTLKVGSGTATEAISAADGAKTVTFTAPATGDVAYICTLHSEMKGTFHVAGTTSEPPKKTSPGLQVFGVALAIAGMALLLRRK